MFTIYMELSPLILCIGNITGGLLPLLFVKFIFKFWKDGSAVRKRDKMLSLIIYFGGGVFMGTSFLILLPESRKMFENHEEKVHTEQADPTSSPTTHHHSFPIPEIIVLCGYFVAFTIEEILHYFLYHFRQKNIETTHVRQRFCSCAKRHTECNRTFKADTHVEQTLFGLERRRNSTLASIHEGSALIIEPNENITDNGNSLLRSSIISQPVPSYGSVATITDAATPEIPSTQIVFAPDGSVAVVPAEPKKHVHRSYTGNVLLLIALSLNGILQGAMYGLIIDTTPWTLFLVIGLYQVVIEFVLGSVILLDSGNTILLISYIIVLSVMSPIGILLAMFTENAVKGIPNIAGAITKDLACGCLLYVIFHDLLRRNENGRPGPHNFFSFILGAAVVAALEFSATKI